MRMDQRDTICLSSVEEAGMALWRKTAILLSVLTLPVQHVSAEAGPSATDIVQTGAQGGQEAQPLPRPESLAIYAEIRQRLTQGFDEGAATANKGAFKAWVENSRNSGFTAVHLTRYDVRSLRAFKEELRSGTFLNWLMERSGMDRESLGRLLRKKIEKLNRETQRERESIDRAARELRRRLAESPYEESRRSIERSLQEIRIQQEAQMLAHQRFSRLSLEEIADEIDGWAIGRFFSNFNGRMAEVMTILTDSLRNRSDRPEFNVQGKPNILGELEHRINLIKQKARTAYGNDEQGGTNAGNKYAVAYAVSWFLSGLSNEEVEGLGNGGDGGADEVPGAIDQAIAIIENAGSTSGAGTEQPDNGVDSDNTGGDGTDASGGNLSQSDLNRAQQQILVAFASELNQVQAIPEIAGVTVPQRSKDEFFRHVNRKVHLLSRAESLMESGLQAIDDLVAQAQEMNHPKLGELTTLRTEFVGLQAQANTLKERRIQQLGQIREILRLNGAENVVPEEIDEPQEMRQLVLRLSRAEISESQRRELVTLVSEYTVTSIELMRTYVEMYAKLNDLVELEDEITDDSQNGPSEKLVAVLDWITRYNRNRTTLWNGVNSRYGSWYTRGDEVAHNYTEAARNLLKIVETSFEDQKHLFNASQEPDLDSASYTQCSSYIPGFNAESMKFPTSNLHAAVSPIDGEVDTDDERRLVCLAGYEYEMKGQNNTYELFKMKDGSPSSFGFRTIGVIQSMGESRSSVASASTAEHSLLEGLYENLAFMRDLNDYLVAWIKRNLEEQGVQVRDGAGETNVRGASANQISLRVADRILFDHNKSDIKAEGQAVLDRVARAFKFVIERDSTIQTLFEKIIVEGHASPPGTRRFNLDLSDKRADAVVEAMRGSGIPVPLNAQAFGESRPLDTNGDRIEYPENVDWNRNFPSNLDEAACRRVEFAFSLNMREIEEILREKGQRYHRLRDLIRAASPTAELPGDSAPQDPATNDPISDAADPTVVEDSEISGEAGGDGYETEPAAPATGTEAQQRLRAGGYQQLDQWIGYLHTAGWPNDDNENPVYYGPGIGSSSAKLRDDAARGILAAHDQLLATDPVRAREFWSVMGKYFETPRGSLGSEVQREQAGMEFVPRAVPYELSGPRNRPTRTNPIRADLVRARDIAAQAAGVTAPAVSTVRLDRPVQEIDAAAWQSTAVRKVDQWEAYLGQVGWDGQENAIWHNPHWIAVNRVALRENFAEEMIQIHNIVIIRSPEKAVEMWGIIGKYFQNSEGTAGNEVQRTSVNTAFTPREVMYDRSGTTRRPIWTNPVQADMRRVFELIRGVQL